MLIITLLFNFLFFLAESRRRYRGGGRGAGIDAVTKTFGNGVATLIRDIKQGNFGQEQPEYDESKVPKFVSSRERLPSNETSPYFWVALTVVVLIIAGLILVCIFNGRNKESAAEQMRKRNQERFKHYQTLKIIAENGVHPDRAFGRLQKIKYKD